MDNGWIKLHRKLKQKGYYKRSAYVHLWVHLLLTANHSKKEFMWNDRIIILKEGQMITGRLALSKATGIPEATVERILNFLENEHQIEQQKTTKYRLITVLNWTDYQNRTEERSTNGQQADTYKNDKNDKKIPAYTGIVEVKESEQPHSVRKAENEKYESLCKWAENRSGVNFVNRVKQYSALKKAKLAGISITRLENRWEELEGETWREGFDWTSVVSSFDKKA